MKKSKSGYGGFESHAYGSFENLSHRDDSGTEVPPGTEALEVPATKTLVNPVAERSRSHRVKYYTDTVSVIVQ